MSPYGSREGYVGDPQPAPAEPPSIVALLQHDDTEQLVAGSREVGDRIRESRSQRQRAVLSRLFGGPADDGEPAEPASDGQPAADDGDGDKP